MKLRLVFAWLGKKLWKLFIYIFKKNPILTVGYVAFAVTFIIVAGNALFFQPLSH